MDNLRDYVNLGLTHCEKVVEAEGVPLVLESCKKNKRMKQLEVYGESIQNGTPSPESPVEVESVGEKCTKNIFNKEDIAYVGGINCIKSTFKSTATGIAYNVTTPGSTSSIFIIFAKASDYAGKWLTFSSPDFYNRYAAITIRSASGSTNVLAGSVYISDGNGLYYSTVYVDEGVYTDETICLRLYGDTASDVVEYSNIMVSVGESPEKYEPYGKYKIPMTVRGKNLFDAEQFEAELQHGYILNNAGEKTSDINSTYSTYRIPLCAGQPIHIYGWFQRYYVYDANDVFVKRSVAYNAIIMNLTYTPTEDGYIRLQIQNEYYNANKGKEQIEEGSVVTIYESYVEPVTTNIYINEPLRRKGDYADVLDFKGKKVVRKIYENDFSDIDDTTKYNVYMMNTGTEVGLRVQYTNAYKHLWMPTDGGLQATYYALCNMYPVVLASKRTNHTVSSSTSNMRFFDIIDTNYQTVDEWKAHLQELHDAGTPLKIIHAVATPYEEAITCELPTVVAKTTVIDIDTNLLPSNIKGKYIKR